MKHRRLGTFAGGLDVSALGLGCMPMAGVGPAMYGEASETESIATLQRAIDLGITFFDTAEVYGPHLNEELVGRAIKGRRDGLVIATKGGFSFENGRRVGVDGSAANMRSACEGSLSRLGIDVIDLYYQHRVDPKVPIEETVGAMAELVKEGKIRHIGLSEAASATVRRAAAIHPITALQSEYSLWERDVEADILPTCRALGIGFVPYSPLGRGFLTGQIKRREDLPEGDYRRNDPRYAEDNFGKNMEIVDVVLDIASRHGVSGAQVALAWLLAQGEDIVPIPGSKRRVTLEDSMAAADLVLTVDDLKRLGAARAVSGARYTEAAMTMVRL